MGWLVSANEAGVAAPEADAVTLYVPAVPLAVAVIEAVPSAPIAAVPADSVAEAPGVGAVNVMTPPLTGSLESLGVTVTASGVVNAAPVRAVCGVPLAVSV